MAEDEFATRFPELANARVRVWFCPVDEHGKRNAVTVEWIGDTAHCTAPGCAITSDRCKEMAVELEKAEQRAGSMTSVRSWRYMAMARAALAVAAPNQTAAEPAFGDAKVEKFVRMALLAIADRDGLKFDECGPETQERYRDYVTSTLGALPLHILGQLGEGAPQLVQPVADSRPLPFAEFWPAEPREGVGRFVRQVWVEWAREQPDPKPSWLLPWEEIDDGQREVDMRIGAALFTAGQKSMNVPVADSELRDRIAGKLHERDCGWNCQGHGIMQERNNQKYRDLADAVLAVVAPALAEHGEKIDALKTRRDRLHAAIEKAHIEIGDAHAALAAVANRDRWEYPPSLLDRIEFVDSELKVAREAWQLAAILLETFVDNEPCRLDHHGYCQEHGWLQDGVCNVRRSRAFLAALPKHVINRSDVGVGSQPDSEPAEPRRWIASDLEPDGVLTVATPGGSRWVRGDDDLWFSTEVMHGYRWTWDRLLARYPYLTEVIVDQPGGET